MNEDKIDSVLSLAKYPIGSMIWFVDFIRPHHIELGESYDYMMMEHPMFVLTRTPYKHAWKSNRKIPKLDGMSFDEIVTILIGKYIVRSITVENITRSENTGEFVYADSEFDFVLPEQVVFSSRNLAQREKTRILKMVIDWATAQLETDKDEMFSVSRSGKKQSNRRLDNRSRQVRD